MSEHKTILEQKTILEKIRTNDTQFIKDRKKDSDQTFQHILLCYLKKNLKSCNGLERQRLIGSAVAGFNLARTITKASSTGLDTGQNDYNKGICFPGSLVNNPVR